MVPQWCALFINTINWFDIPTINPIDIWVIHTRLSYCKWGSHIVMDGGSAGWAPLSYVCWFVIPINIHQLYSYAPLINPIVIAVLCAHWAFFFSYKFHWFSLQSHWILTKSPLSLVFVGSTPVYPVYPSSKPQTRLAQHRPLEGRRWAIGAWSRLRLEFAVNDDRLYIQMRYHMISGWWYTYPSEKYECQLGLLFPIYGKSNSCSKPPTRYIYI